MLQRLLSWRRHSNSARLFQYWLRMILAEVVFRGTQVPMTQCAVWMPACWHLADFWYRQLTRPLIDNVSERPAKKTA